jgi:hypothetical protein
MGGDFDTHLGSFDNYFLPSSASLPEVLEVIEGREGDDLEEE